MKNFLHHFYKNTHNIYKAILLLISLVSIIYLFPREGKYKYEFEKNKPWQYENLYAPFDFSVLKTKKEIAKQEDSIRQNADLFFKKKRINIDSILTKTDEDIKHTFDKNLVSQIIDFNHQFIDKIYNSGLINAYPKNITPHKIFIIEGNKISEIDKRKLFSFNTLSTLIKKKFPSNAELVKRLSQIYKDDLTVSLVPDNYYFEKSLDKKLKNISIYKGMILKGSLVISKGELVSEQKYQQLLSLEKDFGKSLRDKKTSLWIYVGYSILVAIVLMMLMLFLKKYRIEIYEDNSKISLILFNMVLLVALTTFTVKYEASYVFVVPMAILPLILKAFFDARVGLFVHVLTILLLGFVVPNSFEFVFLQIMAGIVTILTVSELTKRSNLFVSVGNIILIYMLGYFAFHLIHEGNFELISAKIFILFLINGIITIALSHQLILIYEKLFGLISDVSLLEWSNTNSKLLKRLADKAPGTFNHSMQVAHLAEAAANEINANSLLVRAGALYHDIGKMLNPFYFTENQTSGVNKHDDLEPEESAQIIINHVLDGVELARKNKLPDRLIDFIRTHHGTGLVQYFYKKALEKNPGVDKEKFRYPGPNPFSKETAILMMADSVEAASKSLREPTAEKIDSFVDKIIDNQLHNGLFDNANITLKEINQIKKLLKKKLKNIYHLRVEYPE